VQARLGQFEGHQAPGLVFLTLGKAVEREACLLVEKQVETKSLEWVDEGRLAAEVPEHASLWSS
jgi:hypothetical protein